MKPSKKKLLMKRKTFIKTNIFCSPLNIKLNQHQSENHCKIKIRKKTCSNFHPTTKKNKIYNQFYEDTNIFFIKTAPQSIRFILRTTFNVLQRTLRILYFPFFCQIRERKNENNQVVRPHDKPCSGLTGMGRLKDCMY